MANLATSPEPADSGSTVVVNGTIVAEASRIDLTTGEVLGAEPESLDDWRRDQLQRAEDEHRIVKLTGPDSVTDPPKITGLDGKTYTRPAPKEPARRPLRDGFRWRQRTTEAMATKGTAPKASARPQHQAHRTTSTTVRWA